MDRSQILHRLLNLSNDADLPLSAAGDYAWVEPDTEGQILRLWLVTLERNP